MNALFPHAARTEDVIVRVSVSFLPEQSELEKERWFWAYHIRIENERHSAIQLLTRHWRISDARGGLHVVDGDGVVGEQPIIQPGKSHDYVSGCPLNTPNGAMQGHFVFAGDGPETFKVHIPHFPLTEPTVEQ